MTNRYYSHGILCLLVSIMKSEWYGRMPSEEFKSTFNRRLEVQLYTGLRRDYAFPRAVCGSLIDLFQNYLDLHFGSLREEG